MSGEWKAGKGLKGIAVSGCIGIAVFWALLGTTAALLPAYPFLVKRSGLAAAVCMFIAAAVGAAICARGAHSKRLPRCAAANLIPLAAILIACAADAGGQISAAGFAKTILIVLFGSFAGTILGGNGKQGRSYRRKYRS